MTPNQTAAGASETGRHKPFRALACPTSLITVSTNRIAHDCTRVDSRTGVGVKCQVPKCLTIDGSTQQPSTIDPLLNLLIPSASPSPRVVLPP